MKTLSSYQGKRRGPTAGLSCGECLWHDCLHSSPGRLAACSPPQVQLLPAHDKVDAGPVVAATLSLDQSLAPKRATTLPPTAGWVTLPTCSLTLFCCSQSPARGAEVDEQGQACPVQKTAGARFQYKDLLLSASTMRVGSL
jgi:hypothetical protein